MQYYVRRIAMECRNQRQIKNSADVKDFEQLKLSQKICIYKIYVGEITYIVL